MNIHFKLDAFEGPLDLLLHLLEKNKVNICDIPIVEITRQYMAYIRHMRENDLNTMSEFLVMAATLLDIKSKMLLPAKEEEEEEADPRLELVARLLEYKMYKSISLTLKEWQNGAKKALYKFPTIPKEIAEYEPPVDMETLIGDITLARLNEVFQSVLRSQREKIDPIRSDFGKIEKEEVSLEETMQYVGQYAMRRRTFLFRALLEGQTGKMHVIVTFLAVLEMMKSGMLTIAQEGPFGEIVISANAAAETIPAGVVL